MPSSAALRKQIESEFQHRYPSALTPYARAIREVASTGIAAIDELLNGGLPIGAISEITGPISSGRTCIAMSLLAQHTRAGSVCAWIDAADTFDPESGAANGICLEKMLWVRCRDSSAQTQSISSRNAGYKTSKPWMRLDQAIRATDLVLQAGGFGVIVLDLGNENIEHGQRIPLATWFRFRQATDRTRCSLIVLGKSAYAQSSAAVVLECQSNSAISTTGTVIQGFRYSAQRGRECFSPITIINRKPPASTWSAQTSWNVERRA